MNILFYFVLFFILTTVSLDDEPRKKKMDIIKKHFKKTKRKEGSIVLTGGTSTNEGNVELFHNGQWGNVCDDEWDIKDGTVVCNQLGYKKALKVTYSSHFGQVSQRYWMDNTFCTGAERRLSDCHFEGWGRSDCDSTEAAGVICSNFSNSTAHPNTTLALVVPKRVPIKGILGKMEVRLMGGRIPEEGRVEIKPITSTVWGTICGDGWSLREAMVICRTLQLGYAGNAAQTSYFGGATSQMILGEVKCRGNESHFENCLIENSTMQCPGRKEDIAGVVCTTVLPDLIIDADELMQSSYLEDRQLFYLQCAMEENCLAPSAYRIQKDKKTTWHTETRRLLRFTARVTNIGNTDFRPSTPKHLWEFHQCHMHFHSMEVFATFDILNEDGEKLAQGHKASFCLEDNQCISGATPSYACANYGDQGISVNCSDIYRHNIDCQWIDISELGPGIYKFRVSINPEQKVPEMTFSNNVATCSMYYTQTFARIYNCVTEHP